MTANEPEPDKLGTTLPGDTTRIPVTERAAGTAVDAVLPQIRDLLAQTFVAGMEYGIEIAGRAT